MSPVDKSVKTPARETCPPEAGLEREECPQYPMLTIFGFGHEPATMPILLNVTKAFGDRTGAGVSDIFQNAKKSLTPTLLFWLHDGAGKVKERIK